MKTVFSIFKSDISSLSRRFFALAVIVGISVLPALYAWVNIYANGNPYANTGGIPVAVASRDPGTDLDDGTHVNMAEDVFDELRKSDKIGWKFPSSPEKAIEGVRSGKYYAAIIFEDNFTYNMYNIEEALRDDKAPLTYYENAKKNAVASKITETASSNLQETIKTTYLETVFGVIFDDTNKVSSDLAEKKTTNTVIAQLEDLRDTLRAYDSAISSFTDKSAGLHSDLSTVRKNLKSTKRTAGKYVSLAGSDLKTARKSLSLLKTILEEREERIETKTLEIELIIEKLKAEGLSDEERAQLAAEAIALADVIKVDLEGLLASLPESTDSAAINGLRNTLTNMIVEINTLEKVISSGSDAADVLEMLKDMNTTTLSSSIDSLITSMNRMLKLMEPLMGSMSDLIDDIDPVLQNADTTVEVLDDSLLLMQTMFRASADKVDNVLNKLESVKDDEKLDSLIDILGGDSEEYATFFSALVDVDVEEIYSVASYGAAMAPFYSVLAIWVGGVILVSILKTHVDRKKFPNATDAQTYFGRYILFFLIGQIQTAIIIAGDIFLLGCEPVHPWMMWFAGAVTSMVFVLLIYSLTLSFGDIGKAVVVVTMVLQIAGSSGSYPIEILPPVFGKIYKFFPFPYAINAVREALCGTYEYDYVKYLAELLLFAVLALAIGLLIRKPFMGMNRFVSEKIEETEVL